MHHQQPLKSAFWGSLNQNLENNFKTLKMKLFGIFAFAAVAMAELDYDSIGLKKPSSSAVDKVSTIKQLGRFFLLTVASPIGNFLPRYLELGTGTPYHETESLVDFSRLGKITHTIKNGHFRLTSGQTSGKNFIFGKFY